MNEAHLTFGFSEEQRQMRASVLGLLDRVLPPARIRELDKAGEYPFEAHKALGFEERTDVPFDRTVTSSPGRMSCELASCSESSTSAWGRWKLSSGVRSTAGPEKSGR